MQNLISQRKHKLIARGLRLAAFWDMVNRYEKTQKTDSPAAFDGPCLGAGRLITGTVAGSTGLGFFLQNQKNRSNTIKTLIAIHQVPQKLRAMSHEL